MRGDKETAGLRDWQGRSSPRKVKGGLDETFEKKDEYLGKKVR